MSIISTVILVHGEYQEDEIKVVNHVRRFFYDKTMELTDVTDYVESERGPECKILIGAFNYFDHEDFFKHLAKYRWQIPEQVACVVTSNDLYGTWIWRPVV